MLYLIGTPIGNTGDISPRACELLASVDLVACEDTRVTGLLLSSLGIRNNLFPYHEHNKAAAGDQLISRLKRGEEIALVSDAGMPSISDPGEDLVRRCIEENIEFTTVPGPVAAITALVMSGLSTRRYHYEGFLPSENAPRKERLNNLKNIRETIIIYEAPHRLMKLIGELSSLGFGGNRAAFCRELTKKYEQVIRLTVDEAKEYFEKTPPKGEFVVCLEPMGETFEEVSDEYILELIKNGKSTKEAAAITSELTGKSKKEMYSYILNLLE